MGKELKGKTIGITAAGASSDNWVRALLAAANVPVSKVKFAIATGATAFGLYQEGRIDAWAGTDPAAAKIVDNGGTVLARFGGAATNPEGLLSVQLSWQGLASYISSHTAQVQAFVGGLQDAAAFIADTANTAKVAADVQKVAGVDLTTVSGGAAGWLALINQTGRGSTSLPTPCKTWRST